MVVARSTTRPDAESQEGSDGRAAPAAGRAKGDELALVDESVERTFVEVNERVNRLVSALREAGLGVGALAGLLSGNRNEFFELITALGHTGVTFVPINWHFSPEEIAYVLEDSGATTLFADHQYGELAVAAAERISAVRHKVSFGGATAEGFVAYEELVASGDPTEPAGQCALTRPTVNHCNGLVVFLPMRSP
jgi:long-chain acyl-CoA synthetase